jgi:predicted anti-sigma-YlaC factor YlaD
MDEMMLECAVVRDLAALYTDGEASETTAAAVAAHLKNCKTCRDYYKEYTKSSACTGKLPVQDALSTPTAESYARLAQRLRRHERLEKGGFALGGFVLGALALAAFGFAAAALLDKHAPTE